MKIIFAVVVLTVVFIVGMIHIERDRTQGLNEIEISYQQALNEIGGIDNRNSSSNNSLNDSDKSTISVKISGAVTKAGTYKIESGDYLLTLIEKAGGLKDNADHDCFDEYYYPVDGDEIYIASVSDTAKISINKATVDELDTLPSIGTTIAQRIVEYREANGDFTLLEQLKKVAGIGDAKFEKIKDYIKL